MFSNFINIRSARGGILLYKKYFCKKYKNHILYLTFIYKCGSLEIYFKKEMFTMTDQEKLAMEALEEIGGGGVIDKIKNMSTTKRALLGTGILALLGFGVHEGVTKGGWSKAAWDKASTLFNKAENEEKEISKNSETSTKSNNTTPKIETVKEINLPDGSKHECFVEYAYPPKTNEHK